MKKYLIKLSISEFLKIHKIIEIKKLTINHNTNMLSLTINKIDLNKLDVLKIKYKIEVDYYNNFKEQLTLKTGFIFGFFILISFTLINSLRINKISFNSTFLINDEIKEILYNSSVNIFNQRFISNYKLREINKNLLENYVSYEYISVVRNGTEIKVIINKDDLKSYDKTDYKIGNIISSKNGIVKEYNIFDGKSLVYLNKVVKKDEILISSDMLHGLNLNTKENVSARGYIICEVLEYVTITVDIYEEETIYTDNKFNKTCIRYFNKDTCSDYDNNTSYIKDEKVLFNFFNLIVLKNNSYQEIYNNKIILDEEKAYNKAKEIINKTFNDNKTIESEKILNIYKLSMNKKKDTYIFDFLVKKLENVSVFQEIK